MTRAGSARYAGVLLTALVLAGCGTDSGGGTGGGSGTSSAVASSAASSAAPTAKSGASPLDGQSFVSTSATGAHTLVAGTSLSLSFDAGRLSAIAGCNSLVGSVDLSGGVLDAPVLASTLLGCEQALQDQDTWLNAFLSGKPTWVLADSTLTLTTSDQTIVLKAVVMNAPPTSPSPSSSG